MGKSKLIAKTCSCCGYDIVGKTKQWWNQDKGYGICNPCFSWIQEREGHSDEYMVKLYGREGEHRASFSGP